MITIERVLALIDKMIDDERRWFMEACEQGEEPSASGAVVVIKLELLKQQVKDLIKEPASEDLEQASIEHANKIHNDTAPGERIAACRYGFKAGAQWQKEKDQKELQIAEEHGILTGMNMEREKMMKDAVEGELDCDDNGSWCSFDSNIVPISQAGNKVKVIIIKE